MVFKQIFNSPIYCCIACFLHRILEFFGNFTLASCRKTNLHQLLVPFLNQSELQEEISLMKCCFFFLRQNAGNCRGYEK